MATLTASVLLLHGGVLEWDSAIAGVQEPDGGDLGIEGATADSFVPSEERAASGGVDERAGVEDFFTIR